MSTLVIRLSTRGCLHACSQSIYLHLPAIYLSIVKWHTLLPSLFIAVFFVLPGRSPIATQPAVVNGRHCPEPSRSNSRLRGSLTIVTEAAMQIFGLARFCASYILLQTTHSSGADLRVCAEFVCMPSDLTIEESLTFHLIHFITFSDYIPAHCVVTTCFCLFLKFA